MVNESLKRRIQKLEADVLRLHLWKERADDDISRLRTRVWDLEHGEEG